MHLEDYKLCCKKKPSIADALACSSRAIKIHYLVRGRNAWNSTWVQHYYSGCMATANSDVELDAEKRRENGSVWSITELPALAIDSESGTLVITQLNSQSPLAGYSAEAVSVNAPPGTQLVEGAKNRYLKPGTSIGLMALSFAHDSRFWKQKPPPDNSVILLYMPAATGRFELITDQLFNRRSQPSGGRQNSICWSIIPSGVKSGPVLGLVSDFQDKCHGVIEHGPIYVTRDRTQSCK